MYTWACPEGVARPLVDRVLEVPAFRALYTFYLDATLKFMLSDAFSDHIVKVCRREPSLRCPYLRRLLSVLRVLPASLALLLQL